MNFSEELKKIIQGDVESSDGILTKYSHDASIFEIKPEVIVFPKDTKDVQAITLWVHNNQSAYKNLAITPRCAGTDMSGGAIGESIIMDFTRYMNELISFDENKGHITVMPGMFYRDFEKLTLGKGWLLPCFTASKELNTVGGMFGNNSAGEQTLQYGKTEAYIVSSKVVFADGNEYTVKPLSKKELFEKIGQNDFEGNIYKELYTLIITNKKKLDEAKPQVSKNSAGYYLWNVINEADEDGAYFDLNKVLVGSQGTLGIATEITYKLIRPKKENKLVVVFLRDLSLLPQIVNIVLPYKPQTFESYDDKTFFLVLRYFYDFVKLIGVKNLFKLIFSFGPETQMTLTHGLPRLILLIEVTADTPEEVEQKCTQVIKELSTIKKIGVHVTKNEFEAKKYWTIRHEAFNLIRYRLKKVKSKPFIDDVVVRPEKLPEFFPKLYRILNEYKDRMIFAAGGHVGDGNMHIYTLVNPNDASIPQMIGEVSDRVYTLVHELGGSITAEHNDGIVRTPYLEQMYGEEIILLFKKTKEIFDNHYFLNPGKKVPTPDNKMGTKEYLSQNIKL
jgi:FAD/FMN-containing dehydrogenase